MGRDPVHNPTRTACPCGYRGLVINRVIKHDSINTFDPEIGDESRRRTRAPGINHDAEEKSAMHRMTAINTTAAVS